MSPNQDAPVIERRTQSDRRKALAHYQSMAESARDRRELADARLLIERLTLDLQERDETIARRDAQIAAIGAGGVTSITTRPGYRTKNDGVTVSTDTYYLPMTSCPRASKVILLTEGGIAIIGAYRGEAGYRGWFPLPRERKHE